MAIGNTIKKPYKDPKANTTATISYVANLCMAVLNLVKAHLIAYGCETSCDHRDTIIEYIGGFEKVLLLYAPLAAIGLWIVCQGLQKIIKKCKGSGKKEPGRAESPSGMMKEEKYIVESSHVLID